MEVFLVWFSILAFVALFAALVLDLVCYGRFASRQLLIHIILLGASVLWLTVFTYALFNEIYVGPLSQSARTILGIARSAISAFILILIPALVLEPVRSRPALRLVLLLVPATLYAVAIGVMLTSMTFARAAIVSGLYYANTWTLCLWGLLHNRRTRKARMPGSGSDQPPAPAYVRSARVFLWVGVLTYPVLALSALPPVLLIHPSFFSSFPRSLNALAWAASLIVAFIVAGRNRSPGAVPLDAVEAYGLTPREREVAALAVNGASYRDIAAALFIAEKTVETHLRNTYQKCGVSNRLELQHILRPDG